MEALMLAAALLSAEPSAVLTNAPETWRRATIEIALNEAEEITDAYQKTHQLTQIGREQLREDEDRFERTIRNALAESKFISEVTFRGWALRDIVALQLAADDFIGARNTLDLITSDAPRAAALQSIAIWQLRAGQKDEALATSRRIADRDRRGDVENAIVVKLVQQGAIGEAETLATQIQDASDKAFALGEIAAAATRKGDRDLANDLARRTAKSQRDVVYQRIALTASELGEFSTASAAAHQVRENVDLVIVLARVSADAARADQSNIAKRLMDDALAAANRMQSRDPRRALTWAHLAHYEDAVDRNASKISLNRAQSYVSELSRPEQRDPVLDVIARTRAMQGELDAAMKVASQLEDTFRRGVLIRDLVASQTTSSSARALAQAVDEKGVASDQAAAWLGAVAMISRQPNASRSDTLSTVESAATAFEAVASGSMKCAGLAALALARNNAGESGETLMQEGLRIVLSMPSPEQKVDALVQILQVLNGRLPMTSEPPQESIH
ncbi:MAG: hypothetical protein ACJ8OJ_11215 [Povalibacter sp.]